MKSPFDTNRVLIKTNRLVEARYKLSPYESKLMALVISQINPKEKFVLYRYKVSDLAKLLEIDVNNAYNSIEETLKRLNTRELLIIKEDGSKLLTTWVSSAEYFKQQGTIEIEVSQKLEPYLLDIKEYFTQYRLKNVLHFKSSYSFRIYELLKQWPFEKIGFRELTLNELKEMLELDSNQYQKYSAFKRYILLKAQEEINGNADISFTFREIKEGRKITKIAFYIQSKEQEKLILPSPTESMDKENDDNRNFELIDTLTKAGLTEKQALEIIMKVPYFQIVKNIEYTERIHKKGNIKNFTGYLHAAIIKDYAASKQEIEQKKESQKQEKELIQSKYVDFCSKHPELSGNGLNIAFMQYMDNTGFTLKGETIEEWELKI